MCHSWWVNLTNKTAFISARVKRLKQWVNSICSCFLWVRLDTKQFTSQSHVTSFFFVVCNAVPVPFTSWEKYFTFQGIISFCIFYLLGRLKMWRKTKNRNNSTIILQRLFENSKEYQGVLPMTCPRQRIPIYKLI